MPDTPQPFIATIALDGRTYGVRRAWADRNLFESTWPSRGRAQDRADMLNAGEAEPNELARFVAAAGVTTEEDA